MRHSEIECAAYIMERVLAFVLGFAAGVILLSFIWTDTVHAKVKDAQISKDAYKACEKYGEQYGICPELLMAIIEVGSGGNPNDVNPKTGCTGLMQIQPKYAGPYMERAGVTSLTGTYSNIKVGCEILIEKFEKYGDNMQAVLGTYHGEKNALKLARKGKMSSYTKKILKRSMELEKLHGKG